MKEKQLISKQQRKRHDIVHHQHFHKNSELFYKYFGIDNFSNVFYWKEIFYFLIVLADISWMYAEWFNAILVLDA